MKFADVTVVLSGVLALLHALYIALLYSLSCSKPPCELRAKDRSRRPRLAVVCAAYNEPLELLERQASFIARSKCASELEYHVVWDGPRCFEAIKAVEGALKASESGKTLLFSYRCRSAKLGKASALNEAASRTRAEYIMVLDVDDYVDDFGRVFEALGALSDSDAGLVLRWRPEDTTEGLREAIALLVDYGTRILYVARCRLGLPILYLGSGSVVRTELVKKLGGWRTDRILEDLDLGLRMVLLGHRLKFCESADVRVGVPPSFLAFARQQQRWAEGALELLRSYATQIMMSRTLRLTEKMELTMYLAQSIVSSLAIALLMLGCLLDPSLYASWLSFFLWTAALALYGTCLIKYLRSELSYEALKSLKLGGAAAAVSATLWLRLLLYSLKGLVCPSRSWFPTPKKPFGRLVLEPFWPEALGFLTALASTTHLALCQHANPLVLLTAAYVVGPLYLIARFVRELS